MNSDRSLTLSELELYRVLERANLLTYYSAFLSKGGDDMSQLCDASQSEFSEIINLVGMQGKPLHIRRLQKALGDFRHNPNEFRRPLVPNSFQTASLGSRRRLESSQPLTGGLNGSNGGNGITDHVKQEYVPPLIHGGQWAVSQNQHVFPSYESSYGDSSPPTMTWRNSSACGGDRGSNGQYYQHGGNGGSSSQLDLQNGIFDSLLMPYAMQAANSQPSSTQSQSSGLINQCTSQSHQGLPSSSGAGSHGSSNQPSPVNLNHTDIFPSNFPQIGHPSMWYSGAGVNSNFPDDDLTMIMNKDVKGVKKGIPVSLLPNAVLKPMEDVRLDRCSREMIRVLPEYPPKRPSRDTKTSEAIKAIIAMEIDALARDQAIRRYSAIYGRFDAPRKTGRPMSHHEVAVNEAAYQLALRMPSLLTRREDLYPIARQVVKMSEATLKTSLFTTAFSASGFSDSNFATSTDEGINYLINQGYSRIEGSLAEWDVALEDITHEGIAELMVVQSKLSVLHKTLENIIAEQATLRISFRAAKVSGVAIAIADIQKQITGLCSEQQRKLEDIGNLIIRQKVLVNHLYSGQLKEEYPMCGESLSHSTNYLFPEPSFIDTSIKLEFPASDESLDGAIHDNDDNCSRDDQQSSHFCSDIKSENVDDPQDSEPGCSSQEQMHERPCETMDQPLFPCLQIVGNDVDQSQITGEISADDIDIYTAYADGRLDEEGLCEDSKEDENSVDEHGLL